MTEELTHLEELKVYTVKIPSICPDCVNDVLSLAATNPKLNQLYHHCPHYDCLAHMRLEKHEGRPAITQWILQGPLPQEEAVKIIKALGDDFEAQVSVLTGSQRLN